MVNKVVSWFCKQEAEKPAEQMRQIIKWNELENTDIYATFRQEAVEGSNRIAADQFESYLAYRLTKVIKGAERPSQEVDTLISHIFRYTMNYPFELIDAYHQRKREVPNEPNRYSLCLITMSSIYTKYHKSPEVYRSKLEELISLYPESEAEIRRIMPQLPSAELPSEAHNLIRVIKFVFLDNLRFDETKRQEYLQDAKKELDQISEQHGILPSVVYDAFDFA